MKIFFLQSREPVSHELRKEMSVILHEQGIKYLEGAQEVSGLFYQKGFSIEANFDFLITDKDLIRADSQYNAEYIENCLTSLSQLLGTSVDRIVLQI